MRALVGRLLGESPELVVELERQVARRLNRLACLADLVDDLRMNLRLAGSGIRRDEPEQSADDETDG